MDNAVLDFRLGKYGFNGSGKPGQIVRAGNENVLNSAAFQAVDFRCPVSGAFIFTDPHAKNVFPAVQINADGNIDRLPSLRSVPSCGHGSEWHSGKPLRRRSPTAAAAILSRWGEFLSVIRLTVVLDTSTP